MLILKRLYARQSHSAKYLRPARADSGILHRKKVLAETPNDVSENDFEELESDFMNVSTSHREHVRQMEAFKEKEKYLIVKRKYFTEKFPNFLTWHDKEQIQYLHNSDPDEWSIEKLSEAFPALPEIIQKIVRNKWTKRTEAKILSHDQSVIKHWTDFKQGKLNSLPSELKEHLKKFSNRSLNLKPFKLPTNKDKIVKNMNKDTEPGEFSEIITSYQRLQAKNGNKIDMQDQDLNHEHFYSYGTNDSTEVLANKSTKQDNTLLTFKELQQRVGKDIVKGKYVSEQEKLILSESKPPTSQDLNTTITLRPEEISQIVDRKHKTNRDQVGFVRKTERDMSHVIYPEKITIPEEHFKIGYSYKLNDCYYDCYGEFLYRVPGMS